MSLWTRVVDFFTGTEEKKVRARTKKGTYKSDDKSTPDVNEAWVGGKAPKPKKKTVKVVRKKKK